MKSIIAILLFFSSIVVFSQDWKKTYAEALTEAVQYEKPIILVFSGSDWCPPCKKMNKRIWGSEVFKTYSSEHYILYNADFPRKKEHKLTDDIIDQNKKLAALHNPKNHFPLVVVMNKEEKVLGKTSYKKITAEAYISHINAFIK